MSLAAHRRVEAVKTGAQILAETKSPNPNLDDDSPIAPGSGRSGLAKIKEETA